MNGFTKPMNAMNLVAPALQAIAKLNNAKDICATRIAQKTGQWPYPQIKVELNRIGVEARCQQ